MKKKRQKLRTACVCCVLLLLQPEAALRAAEVGVTLENETAQAEAGDAADSLALESAFIRKTTRVDQ